jgi:hypothetical protein
MGDGEGGDTEKEDIRDLQISGVVVDFAVRFTTMSDNSHQKYGFLENLQDLSV